MTNPNTEKANATAAPPAPEVVNCTINGKAVAVAPGTRIIEAAEQAGVGVAHYCYHPGLSAPAMCRMCLVEVEGMPKLAPACVTTVSEGQVINTESDKSKAAREGVLEFYLLNHPLDCPVCDAAGECKLQDYVHQEGRGHGRVVGAKRVMGQDDFGGDVLYDADRCIMCTRCVRFMREIAGEDRLCVVQRGHRSVIDTFFDKGLEESMWAGNVIDICPVGALLSKDWLHKARAWDLDRNPSICASCSQGCNITIDTRDNVVTRLKPRQHPDVNSYWMCDYGRYRYEWLNAADRAQVPLLRDAAGALRPAGWQEAILAVVERLKGAADTPVHLIGSPFHSNEDMGLLARLGELLGAAAPVFRSAMAEDEVVCPGFPALARRRELAANGRGLEALGFRRVGDEAGTGGLPDVSGAIVIAVGDALEDAPAGFGADAAFFVYLGSQQVAAAANAHVLLPVNTYAEQEGTFTNFEGRVQRFAPALQGPGLARPAWQVLGVILAGMDDGLAPATAGDAFLRIAQLNGAFAGLSYAVLGGRGAMLNEPARVGPGGAA